MPPGDEARAKAAYEHWLRADGWMLTLLPKQGNYPDIDAQHPEHGQLIAEVKGVTSSPGTDVDTAYGQLLRRMGAGVSACYALVIPETALKAALRVPAEVRTRLGIEVYAVAQDGTVRHVDGRTMPPRP
jgi:hypothetical protein